MNELEFDYRESDEAIEAEAYRQASVQANNDLNRKNRLAQAHNEEYKGQAAGMYNPYDFTESLVLKNTKEYRAYEGTKQAFALWGPGWEKFGEGMFQIKELMAKPLEAGAEVVTQYGKERVAKAASIKRQRADLQEFEEQQLLKGGG